MSELKEIFEKIITLTKSKTNGGGNQYYGKCPAHNDTSPSLSISIQQGQILLFCHAGCDTNQILRKLGMNMKDLFESSPVGNQILQNKNEKKLKQMESESRAKEIWDQSTEATDNHPYLLCKKVRKHGLKLSQGKLVVPLYDENSVLQSLQFINLTGEKKFLGGGRTKGCYYPIGEIPEKTLYVAEGFATAATIQEIVGGSVAVAFNANNLKPVAISLREKFPKIEIVICADDDHKTEGNPGITKAIEAAKASGSKITVPVFDKNRREKDTDFNDLYHNGGTEEVVKCVGKTFEPENLEPMLATNKLMKVIENVKNGDLGAHLENDVLPAWRLLKQADRAQFERLRAEVRGIRGVRIGALDEAFREGGGDEAENLQVADRLVEIVNMNTELFHDSSNNCYATFTNKGHRECWELESSGFRDWLSYMFFLETRGAPSETALNAALGTLSGQAKFEGPERKVFRRVAKDGEALWIDLCDEEWKAIKVLAGGWKVVEDPPDIFVRSQTMNPLPIPSEKGDLDPLWSLINIPEEERILLVCWILECYRVETPYVVLELIGEQGSAKSKTQYILRDFVDPNQVNLRAKPKNRESLFVSAENSHLVSYENLSHLQPELQDAFCTLATGGGFADRTLYTNKEETIIEVKRPVVLNGISVLVTAQDLLDRTLHIDLPRILKRKTEKDIEIELEENKQRIFGGLLDLLAKALQILPSVKIDQEDLPRMADFSYLGEAVYRALGKSQGAFLSDYGRNRSEGVHRTIDSSPVASKLIKFLEGSWNKEFKGTIGALYEELNERTHPEEAWPKTARGFGSALRRLAPSMRVIGYEVELDEKRRKDGYHCLIRKVRETVEMKSSETWIDNNDEPLFEGDDKHQIQTELEYEDF